MNFATDALVSSLMSMSREEIGARMIASELEQGFTLVKDAAWLDWHEWDEHTIITQDNKRVRLVALQAKNPGTGAFTRLIRKIFACNQHPVLVEPNQLLIDWCERHDFRSKRIGKGKYRHELWYPMRCAY